MTPQQVRAERVPTVWTRRLQTVTFAFAVILTIGTALQNFVFVDRELIELAMRYSGSSPEEIESDAPGFLLGFRVVGTLYIIGNAVGLLAFTGKTWVYWVAIVVNATQAMGVVGAIPPEVLNAMQDLDGGAAYITTLIVDGGGLLLAVVLIGFFIKFRNPWAQTRSAAPARTTSDAVNS